MHYRSWLGLLFGMITSVSFCLGSELDNKFDNQFESALGSTRVEPIEKPTIDLVALRNRLETLRQKFSEHGYATTPIGTITLDTEDNEKNFASMRFIRKFNWIRIIRYSLALLLLPDDWSAHYLFLYKFLSDPHIYEIDLTAPAHLTLNATEWHQYDPEEQEAVLAHEIAHSTQYFSWCSKLFAPLHWLHEYDADTKAAQIIGSPQSSIRMFEKAMRICQHHEFAIPVNACPSCCTAFESIQTVWYLKAIQLLQNQNQSITADTLQATVTHLKENESLDGTTMESFFSITHTSVSDDSSSYSKKN